MRTDALIEGAMDAAGAAGLEVRRPLPTAATDALQEAGGAAWGAWGRAVEAPPRIAPWPRGWPGAKRDPLAPLGPLTALTPPCPRPTATQVALHLEPYANRSVVSVRPPFQAPPPALCHPCPSS